MESKECHARRWLPIACIVWMALMVVASAFGQEQPGQMQPGPGAGIMRPEAGGRGPRGMPGPGMREPGGPGVMPGGPGLGQREGIGNLLRPEVQKELGITTEQRRKLEDIRFNTEKESIQHAANLRILRMELAHLVDADNADRPSIDKKIQEVAQEEAALMRSSVNERLGVRSVLTPEQRIMLEQIRQNHRQEARPPDMGAMAPRAGRADERPAMPAVQAKPQPQ